MQVLLDEFEEYLDVPLLLVGQSYVGRCPRHLVGNKLKNGVLFVVESEQSEFF